jgi:hypothetical protein
MRRGEQRLRRLSDEVAVQVLGLQSDCAKSGCAVGEENEGTERQIRSN